MDFDNYLLAILILAAAILFSSVGHAGASGYLAAMALFGVAPSIMKPTALALNIFVAVIAATKYYRVGAFSWRIFWPLALASVPFAYVGGLLTLPSNLYKPLVGAVLLYAAWRSFHTASSPLSGECKPPHLGVLLSTGAGLGFLSGLTGVGGGIFLSPLLLLNRWAETKVISGIAAAFILVNSIAGFLGVLSKSPTLPAALPMWAIAAVIGGFIGAELGSRHLGNQAIQRVLAVVLAVAGVKMILTA